MQKLLGTVANALKEGAPRPLVQVEDTVQNLMVEIDGSAKHFTLPLDLPLREAREHFDAIYFDYHLQKEDGNVSRVAEKIGLERTHLYRKLKQLGIKVAKKSADHES